jgi:DNA-binding NtrC family response regulator
MSLLNRPTLIALCDDGTALKHIEPIASAWFTVVATRSVERALGMLKTDGNVAAFLADQKLNNTGGTTVLARVKEVRPELRRILVCGPGNLADIIEGLQSGAVGRIVYKPIHAQELIAALPLPELHAKRATA